MSAIRIVERLLKADSAVTDNIELVAMTQPTQPPFIVISHVAESQESLLAHQVEHFETRVSVEVMAATAIECDRQSEAVKTALGAVIHQRVGAGINSWSDVCIRKAGGDTLDYNDDRTVYRRTIDFYVRWKPA